MEEKKTQIRAALTVAVFALLIGGFFLLNLVLPKPEVLESERRKPAGLPSLTWKSVMSSDFMDDFAAYTADNFAFREQLRTLRALSVFTVFAQTDKSGLYLDALVGAGKYEKVNEASVAKAAGKIERLAERYFNDAYCAVIPDKSVYADRAYPGFSAEQVNLNIDGVKLIDLTDSLEAGSFYKTDLHWDQAKLRNVLETLGVAMGFDAVWSFTEETVGAFHGVYAGQLALPLKPDTMTTLTSGAPLSVRYLNANTLTWEEGALYDPEAVSGRDPYDVFLRGAQPLIEIQNPEAGTERQLYLFRDSFGSSLAPLLAPLYKTVTLIDLRYIDSRLLPELLDIDKNADALFLYGSKILNNADVLMTD